MSQEADQGRKLVVILIVTLIIHGHSLQQLVGKAKQQMQFDFEDCAVGRSG